MPSTIILIGPINAGKSTLAALLSQSLEWPRCSLDEVGWHSYQEQGYEEALASPLQQSNDLRAFHSYMEPFYASAVERVLAEHPQAVIDFGAGHSVYADARAFARVQQALAPYPNVILLLPSPDRTESLQILTRRKSHRLPSAAIHTMNAFFFSHRSSFELAKLILYTKYHTPEQTCQELRNRLNLSAHHC